MKIQFFRIAFQVIWIVIFAVVVIPYTAIADDEQFKQALMTNGASSDTADMIVKEVKEKKIEDNTRKFAGMNFGVGLSLTIDLGKHNRIDEAKVVNGIVRITKESNDVPRLLLETHYFFKVKKCSDYPWGYGPFIALQNGSDEVISAIGVGFMVGMRRKDASGIYTSDSFNLGIGLIVDPKVKILGDGISENRPLPPGETEIRYKETSQMGLPSDCFIQLLSDHGGSVLLYKTGNEKRNWPS